MTWTTPVHLSDAYGDAVMTDTPKGYWKLDSTFADFSGGKHVGSAFGSYLFALGAYQTAVYLDGTSFFSVVDHADLDLGDVLTLEAWVLPTSTGTVRNICDKGTGGYIFQISATNFLQFGKTGTAIIVTSTVAIPSDGAWHHVVATKNGATVKLYIDGIDRTGTVTNQTLANTSNDLHVGRDWTGGNSYYGGLDEVAVYSTAISSARVTAHFNARATVAGTVTAAVWNAQVADNLLHLYNGKTLYVPSDPSGDLAAPGKVHGFRSGAFCMPVINRDLITLNSMAYRSDTANGKVDLGVYIDDGNGTTCSKISTTGLTAMPAGAGTKQISLLLPAPILPYTKYWLVIGFAITKSGSGGKLGTVLGTDGPLKPLCKRAVNVMPLPTVITFDAVAPTAAPMIAGFP